MMRKNINPPLTMRERVQIMAEGNIHEKINEKK